MKPFVPLNAALVKLPGLFAKPLNWPGRRRDIFYCADNHRVAQNKAPRWLELVPSRARSAQLKLKNDPRLRQMKGGCSLR